MYCRDFTIVDTVKDYAHVLNSSVKFKFETKDILVETMATARSSCEAS